MRAPASVSGALAGAIVLAACSASPGPAASHRGPRHYTVGIFLLDESAFVAPVIDGFKKGFLRRAGASPSQVSWDVQNAADNEALVTSIAHRYATSSDDVVAVLGTPAVIAMAQVDKNVPPIVAIAMGDPVGAGVAVSLRHPGRNVTGTTDFIPPSRLVQVILQVTPLPKVIGSIYDSSDQNMTVWIAALRAALKAIPHAPRLIATPVSDISQVAPAAAALAGRVDALLIGPDALVAGDGLPAVARTALTGRIPLYIAGGELTSKGITATIGANYVQLGQQAGILAAQVAAGGDPGSIPFSGPSSLEIEFSRSSVRADRLHLPASLMHSAKLGP